MTLTPERRAELRGLAESAQPFIRYGGTDAASVTLTLTRAGGHYLAECETRPRKG